MEIMQLKSKYEKHKKEKNHSKGSLPYECMMLDGKWHSGTKTGCGTYSKNW